ncbi:MAG: prohibitin family protein [Candidatus Niyogibacteria bacterium]|nr:MAG: prohibitin family protein [Candidatus Niyogibacteria bacterium]
MGWIVVIVLLGLVFVAFAFAQKFFPEDLRILPRLVRYVVFALAGIITFVSSFYQIPAGEVGVISEFGAITGQISEGPKFVAPWKSVLKANVRVRSHQLKKLDSFSRETQDVFVDATLNIRVSPQTIQQLYRTVGPDYFDVLVRPRVAQNFKDETVKYNSVDIAPNREKIRKTVRERLERELSPYSIEVVDLLLDNIDFRKAFKESIEAKQIATQKALEEEQKVKASRFVALQVIEKAKGEGQATLERATKQAEANAKLAASLTPALIQWQMIQRLSDKVSLIMIPPGQSFILDPKVLTPKK